MKATAEIQRYSTSAGTRVYRLPVEAFPRHVTNCYLALTDPLTLIDTASGWAGANERLAARFEQLRDEFGERVTLGDVRSVVITHGHIDHFGGLNFVVEHSGARVAVHELDMSLVQYFKERLILSSRNLQIYLERAGLPEDTVNTLMQMNKWSKDVFRSVRVDVALREGDRLDGGFTVHHTPGHCPGQVCLQLDDLLFTGDHVLSEITPLQSPEFIMRYTGLGHYFDSLAKVRALANVSLSLPAHEADIVDLPTRVDEIVAFHEARLARVLEICTAPKSVAQIARELFGEPKDYHVLLAFLETGAHVEYLYERGRLAVVNADEVERASTPVFLYQRT